MSEKPLFVPAISGFFYRGGSPGISGPGSILAKETGWDYYLFITGIGNTQLIELYSGRGCGRGGEIMVYNTFGTCSTQINFDVDDEHRVHNVVFTGGCNGNLKAIGKLVEGQKAEDVIKLLKGNTCSFKPTSCADQLARALEQALAEKN